MVDPERKISLAAVGVLSMVRSLRRFSKNVLQSGAVNSDTSHYGAGRCRGVYKQVRGKKKGDNIARIEKP